MHIELHVQSRETALLMRQNWRGSCYALYGSLFNALCGKGGTDSAADQ